MEENFSLIDPNVVAVALNSAPHRVSANKEMGWRIVAGDDEYPDPTWVDYFPTFLEDRDRVRIWDGLSELNLNDTQMFAQKGRVRFRGILPGGSVQADVSANGSVQYVSINGSESPFNPTAAALARQEVLEAQEAQEIESFQREFDNEPERS